MGTLLLRSLVAAVKCHSDKLRSVFFTSTMRLSDLILDAVGSLIYVSDDIGFPACCGFTRVEFKLYLFCRAFALYGRY